MRILTALERVAVWHSAATVYHLTDNPDFVPDPQRRPTEGLHWTRDPATSPQGLYVTTTPNYWRSWGNRPYAVEFDVPDDLLRQHPPTRNYPEHLIPPEHFGDMKLQRIVPFSGLMRENGSSTGGFDDAEYAMGQDFETRKPFPTRRGPNGAFLDEDRKAQKDLWAQTYGTGPYRYPTDARDMTPAQRRKYERWYSRYWDEAYKESDDD